MNSLNKILLVDDDDVANFLSLKIIVKSTVSKKIEIRKSGKEALEHLQECITEGLSEPELILLDLEMPEMDGTQFLKEYEELKKKYTLKSKIVLLSTSKPRHFHYLNENFNIEAYLIKPLTIKKFLDVVELYKLKEKSFTYNSI